MRAAWAAGGPPSVAVSLAPRHVRASRACATCAILDPAPRARLSSLAAHRAARTAARTAFGGNDLAIIRLEGLSVFGHHGARPYEKEAGQRLEVDLELDPTDDRSEKSDKLADAVDYDELYKTVREVVETKSFHLLEALAAATAETILERFD